VTAGSAYGNSYQNSVAEQRPGVRLRDRLAAHVEIWRLDLFSYTGLVSVAGALLASAHWPAWRLVGTWLAPSLGWVAAMYGGDYFDRDLDTMAKPQRPLPSGRVKPREAFAGMVTCVLLGMVIAVLLNPWNFFVVLAALTLGVSYSKYLKARGIWGNLVRGGVTAMALIHGTLATSPSLQLRLLPIALVFWLHDSGSNVVGAICDREGDRAGGYRTFPVRHGDTPALWVMLAFDLGWVALAAGYALTLGGRFRLAFYVPFLAVAALMGLVCGLMLLFAPRPVPRLTSLRAHEVLVVERLVLTSGFVAAVTGPPIAVALLVPSAGAWLVASVVMMRRSYEPSRVRPRSRVEQHEAGLTPQDA
jgi:4-hydroxybenzoate polyprenyltransferase/geranylgeranylglycerol-phosphate geranylgeranyltransferase